MSVDPVSVHEVGTVVWATCDAAVDAGARLTYRPCRGCDKRRPWLFLGRLDDGREAWASMSTTPHPDQVDIPRAARLGLRIGTHAIPGMVALFAAPGFAWARREGRLHDGEIPIGLLIGAVEAARGLTT
jgi:hypothetical protein